MGKIYNYFDKTAKFPSILTGQHDHPVLAIPAGIQRYGLHGKVCVGDFLPS